MNPAPIALFCFNRPHHLKRVVDSLKANPLARKSELFVFADSSNEPDAPGILDVRQVLADIDGFKSIKIIIRDQHLGLSKNTIAGLNYLSDRFGKFIMLEDDTVCSPFFLEWTNHMLEKLQDETKVASVQGYVYPGCHSRNNYFVHSPDTWGWGTWKKGWDLFQNDPWDLLHEIRYRQCEHRFNMDGCYNYLRMLIDNCNKDNDSWSIRFYASIFLRNMLTLYPAKALIRNIGFDGTGVHCSAKTSVLDCELSDTPVTLCIGEIEENKEARAKIGRFMKSLNLRIFWDCFLHGRWLTIIKAVWRRL